jgi:hypothetical protein
VPGLSCEHGIHRGERGVHQRVGCARREKGFIEMAGKIIKQTKLKEEKWKLKWNRKQARVK